MDRQQSQSALTAGIVLALLFLAVPWSANISLLAGWGFAKTLSSFLNPSFKEPALWLGIRLSLLLPGLLGAFLLYRAATSQGLMAGFRRLRSSGRGLWAQIVWAILLAHLLHTILVTVQVAGYATQGPRGAGLRTIILGLGFVPPLAGIYCCARLLFGNRRRTIDRWLGYIAAISAAFGLAWTFIDVATPNNLLGPFSPTAGAYRLDNLTHVLSALFSLLVQWATIRAGLSLARHDLVPIRPHTALSAACLLLAGFIAAAIAGNLHGLAYQWPRVGSSLAVPYLLALAAGAACAVLAIAQWLTPLAREDSPALVAQPGQSAWRASLASLRDAVGGRFWGEFGIGIISTLVLSAVAFGLASTIPVMALAFIFPLVMAGFLIGPVIVFIFGIVRGKPGIAAAPALMFLAVIGYRAISLLAASMRADGIIENAAALNVHPFAEATQIHDTVAIEYSYESLEDRDCEELCQRILRTSDYTVAILKEQSDEWQLYRKSRDSTLCSRPAQIDSYLDMMSRGYIGTCIVKSRQAEVTDALVIRESKSQASPLRDLMPKGLQGEAFEFYERSAGMNRLLGRIVSGGVSPPLMSSQKRRTTPIMMNDAAFYTAALKLPLADAAPSHDIDVAKIVAVMEPLLLDPAVGMNVRQAFQRLGHIARTEQDAAPIQSAILRFWQSSDQDLVVLGIRSLLSIDRFGLAFAQQPLAGLILDDRIAIDVEDKESMRALTDTLKDMDAPFPEHLRRQAWQQLTERSLQPVRVFGLLAITTRGDRNSASEISDWLHKLPDEQFEQALKGISLAYDILEPQQPTAFWPSDDMGKIVDRAQDVPSDRLVSYIDCIRRQMTFAGYALRVRALLTERADALKTGTKADLKLANELERLARRLDR